MRIDLASLHVQTRTFDLDADSAPRFPAIYGDCGSGVSVAKLMNADTVAIDVRGIARLLDLHHEQVRSRRAPRCWTMMSGTAID
jgi:hypothetical protein